MHAHINFSDIWNFLNKNKCLHSFSIKSLLRTEVFLHCCDLWDSIATINLFSFKWNPNLVDFVYIKYYWVVKDKIISSNWNHMHLLTQRLTFMEKPVFFWKNQIILQFETSSKSQIQLIHIQSSIKAKIHAMAQFHGVSWFTMTNKPYNL